MIHFNIVSIVWSSSSFCTDKELNQNTRDITAFTGTVSLGSRIENIFSGLLIFNLGRRMMISEIWFEFNPIFFVIVRIFSRYLRVIVLIRPVSKFVINAVICSCE